MEGRSKNGFGVLGQVSGQPDVPAGQGIVAYGFLGGTDPTFEQLAGVYGQSDNQGVIGLTTAQGGRGVYGGSAGGGVGSHTGVMGETSNGVGVWGIANPHGTGFGVRGDSEDGVAGVHGNGGHNGVWGYTVSQPHFVLGDTSEYGSGVFGENGGVGQGVLGYSKDGIGVLGRSFGKGYAAVHGNGAHNGVWGYTVSPVDSGVYGQNDGSGYGVAGISKGGIGVLGRGGQLAGRFEGNVLVTGDITAHDVILNGGDCAEDFDIAGLEAVEAGTVMVIDKEGALRPCQEAYDKKVTGVISGAGEYKPGLILGRRESTTQRLPLALVGRVYCKVDAQFGPIEIGDLLTTSSTLGHAMKADSPLKAFGAVIGKALRPRAAGRGLIPILVALQ